MKKKITYLILSIIALIIISFFIISSEKEHKGVEAIVYKSSSCGCCGNYIPFLKQEGFNVKINIVEDISSIKTEYGIPQDMESCHTIVIGNYFVEGHVPLEAINKLLSEQPDIDGIALPNMPAGAPGMPGTKAGEFIIYSIKDGNSIGEFMRI